MMNDKNSKSRYSSDPCGREYYICTFCKKCVEVNKEGLHVRYKRNKRPSSDIIITLCPKCLKNVKDLYLKGEKK